MDQQIELLKKTFHEIFQSDQAELDFGIYRIMREKRIELDNYLEGQLLIDLRQSFQKWQTQTIEDLQKQLNDDITAAIRLGFDPDSSTEIKKKREILEATKYTENLIGRLARCRRI